MKFEGRSLGRFRTWQLTVQGLVCGITLAWGWGRMTSAASAAERITLRLGPFEQQVAVSDLEQFAKTGEVPRSLRFYAPILSTQVREFLNRQLQVDPNVADKVVAQVLRSPTGKTVIDSVSAALPNTTVDQLQATVSLAARQFNGLSAINLLRAYPEENITVDASAVVSLALQFNPTYWQSQALSPLLERELAPVTSSAQVLPKFDPARRGMQVVQQQTLFLTDYQRFRTIPVDLYTSTNPQGPLVVISHGFGSDRKFFASTAEHIASYGFTVAALEHPGSSIKRLGSVAAANDPNEIIPAQEFINRPQDITFVLNRLTRYNQQPGALRGKLNTQQVTVIGHSLGGYTALALAGGEVDLDAVRQSCRGISALGQAPADWLQCAAADLPERRLNLRDRRVAQVVALNPLVGNLFGKTGLMQVTTPVLMLAGTEDAVTPILNHQLRPFNQLQGQKYLITAIGGTHLSIGDLGNLGRAASVRTLVKERWGDETLPLQRLASGAMVAFIKQLTPEAQVYAPFLTPAYAQSLSTAQLPLRLNTKLPSTLDPWVGAKKNRLLMAVRRVLRGENIVATGWWLLARS
jgi:predicted dienelactone hydrolase